jgi:hypothetical protein
MFVESNIKIIIKMNFFRFIKSCLLNGEHLMWTLPQHSKTRLVSSRLLCFMITRDQKAWDE